MAGPGFAHAFWQQDVVERLGTPWHHQYPGEQSYIAGLMWPWEAFWLSPPGGMSTAQSAFPWSWFLPLAALFGVFSSDRLTARASAYLLCCLLCFLAIIIAAEASEPWYVAPAYPIIAVLTALGIGEFRNRLAERPNRLHLVEKATLPACILLGVASVLANVAKTERSLNPANYSTDRQLHYFLKSFASRYRAYPRVRVVRVIDIPAVVDGKNSPTERYDGPIQFYVLKIRTTTAQGAGNVQVVGSGYASRPGDIIIGCGESVRASYPSLSVLKIEGRCFALGNPAETRIVPISST